MSSAVQLVERAFSAPAGHRLLLLVSLAAQILAGAVTYIAAAFVLLRPAVDELLRLGRDAIRRRRR